MLAELLSMSQSKHVWPTPVDTLSTGLCVLQLLPGTARAVAAAAARVLLLYAHAGGVNKSDCRKYVTSQNGFRAIVAHFAVSKGAEYA